MFLPLVHLFCSSNRQKSERRHKYALTPTNSGRSDERTGRPRHPHSPRDVHWSHRSFYYEVNFRWNVIRFYISETKQDTKILKTYVCRVRFPYLVQLLNSFLLYDHIGLCSTDESNCLCSIKAAWKTVLPKRST